MSHVPSSKTYIEIGQSIRNKGGNRNTDFRDTLAVLATVENGPRYPTRVLALEEKRLGLSILESEDLAVATDVQLTLKVTRIVSLYSSLRLEFEPRKI